MSTAPESLKLVRQYLVDQTAIPPENVSIRAARSWHGYHAGYADIYDKGEGVKDYSVRRPRDRRSANLASGKASANASSGLDVKFPAKSPWRRGFTPWLAAQAKAGMADIQECIGPDAAGLATYWGKSTNWQPTHKNVDQSHAWHTHISYPRDTEFGDRVAMLKPYFEARR